MMENFSNLMREKVTQIQDTQKVPIKRSPKRHTWRHITIKMAKFEDKERILWQQRKTGSNTQGSPNKTSNWLLHWNTTSQKGMARNSPNNEKQGRETKTTLSIKALNLNERPNKELPKQKKPQRIHHLQNSTERDAKVSALKKGKRVRARERNTGTK